MSDLSDAEVLALYREWSDNFNGLMYPSNGAVRAFREWLSSRTLGSDNRHEGEMLKEFRAQEAADE